MSDKPSAHVMNLAKLCKSHASVKNDVIEVDRAFLKDSFKPEYLPEGTELTLKQYRAAQQHDQAILAATKMAVGEEAFRVLKSKQSYDNVRSAVHLGDDKVEYTVQREKAIRNPQTGDVSTVNGFIRVNYKKRGVKGTGETSKVNTLLDGLREELLG